MSTGATSVRLPALSQAEFEVLGESVFCDDEIGIDWRVVESLPDEAELSRRNLHNEKVLRALALFEEHDQSPSDESERAELHRLEGKIDLLLELVTVLVRDQQGGDRVRNARFNTRGLCWDSTRPPAKSALIALAMIFPAPTAGEQSDDSDGGEENGGGRDALGCNPLRAQRRDSSDERVRGAPDPFVAPLYEYCEITNHRGGPTCDWAISFSATWNASLRRGRRLLPLACRPRHQ